MISVSDTPLIQPVVRLMEAFEGFARTYRHWREVRRLEQWSDAQLADIGLHRSDINRALTLSYGDDPTIRLSEWRNEAVAARRAQAAEARAALAEIETRQPAERHALSGSTAKG